MAIKPIPLIILLVVCCLAVSALATTNKNLDSSGYHGDQIGNNIIQASSEDSVYIICDKLYLHQEPVEKSACLRLLTYCEEAQLISASDGWLQVNYVFMNDNEVQSVSGWLDSDYCVCAAAYYIAMHPTQIRIAPKADASLICYIDTYDSLRVLYEINDYYCVSINGAVGFVEKESGQED